ncbi:MAG TPA: xanthine dehydrogenase family protein molybdopterin-binding subunit [Thermoanaerobaculia bacterium]|nr:xanthine dehydrogenase family protein molybdopterin-binding subunit [Thermoanaerobaculia bacterium]
MASALRRRPSGCQDRRHLMSAIGHSPPRPDGFAKASGAAVYADDLALPGTWFGATVRSAHPHARVVAVRFAAELAPEGAFCLTAADLPGPNGVQLIDDSWPVLAAGRVRHVGEPVALVAAPTRLGARQAAAAVEVETEPLPAVTTLAEAAAADVPPLAECALVAGDVDAAFAAAPVVVEGSWESGHQEHVYIETNAVTAWWEDDGGVVVHGSMQCPYYVHKALVHAFGLPAERVRVQASTVGGGFGGKEDFPSLIGIHAALLSRAAGRPVRLAYDRHEDVIGTTKRHPAVIRHRTAAAEDGTLLAIEIDLVMDGGAYRTLSPVVLSRGVLHATGPYRCPNVRVRGRVLATHTAPNGAFRGFGAPQTQLAMERQIDLLARRVGLDPLEIRRRNAVRAGDRLPTGQVLDESTSALECLERAAARTGFAERWRRIEAERAARPTGAADGDGAPLPGLGLSLYFHGAGFTGSGERRMESPVGARLLADGRVEVLTAMTDMGQGCAAVFPQIAAAAGGLGEDGVLFAPPDTARVPDSGPTVASRTTMIVGATIARAVAALAERVRAWWAAERGGIWTIEDGHLRFGDGVEGERVPFPDAARAFLAAGGDGEIVERHRPPDWQRFDEETYQGAAYPAFGWGCDVVEVAVDPDTLSVTAVAATAVCEVGRALHPVLCAGQIEGGTLQAIGWATCEEVKLDGGRYLNDRLATYVIPTALDAPRVTVELLERPWEGGPFGAKGVGELPMDGGAPAVAQAIENATGVAVTAIPATPERLWAAREAGRRVEPFAAAAERARPEAVA